MFAYVDLKSQCLIRLEPATSPNRTPPRVEVAGSMCRGHDVSLDEVHTGKHDGASDLAKFLTWRSHTLEASDLAKFMFGSYAIFNIVTPRRNQKGY